MENITVLASERRFGKSIISSLTTVTLPQIIAVIMCLVFSRASFFGILKPFATAFYVSLNLTGISKIFAILSITVGNVAFSNIFETIRQTLALLLFETISHIYLKILRHKETQLTRATLIAILVFVTGFLRGLVQGIRIYDLVVSVLCAALTFSLTIILVPVYEMLNRQKVIYDSKIKMCKYLILCMFVISLEGITVFEIELGSVIACFAIIIIARKLGSSQGALAGAVLGVVLLLYNQPISMELTGMLALAGAISGIPVKSRFSGVLLWNFVIVLYAAMTLFDGILVIKYYEALIAGILYLLMPQPVLDFVNDKFIGNKISTYKADSYNTNKTNDASDKLFVLSKALSRVSRNIEETLEENNGNDTSIAELMMETVVEKVCNRCSLCERCWSTHFLKSYKLVEKTISELKTDELGKFEIPAWFKNTCPKFDKFFETIICAYSIYKAENIWRIKLNENRLLLAKQGEIISNSVMSIARNLLDSLRDFETEDILLKAAGLNGITVSDFRYYNKSNKVCLEAVYDNKNKVNVKELDDLVKKHLSSSISRIGETRRDIMGYSVIRYMKQPRFKTANGIARVSRENDSVSGDSFTFFISPEGYHISAISDGAGSGKRAEHYSKTAIQLLENLIEDGIEIGFAIKLLSLYLNVRGESEQLATMDVCAIDLSYGQATFYKFGAPSSFKKENESTTLINNEQLKPISMKTGDFIVMVSDGVIESFLKDIDYSDLQLFISSINTINA